MNSEFEKVKAMKSVSEEDITKLLDDICKMTLSDPYNDVYKNYSDIIYNRKHHLNDQRYEVLHYIFVSSNHKVIKISVKYDTKHVGNSSPCDWCYAAENIEITNIEGFNYETTINLSVCIKKMLINELESSIVRTIWHD